MIGCGLVALAGLGLVICSRFLPVFTVPFEQASAAYQAWCTVDARVDHLAGERYRAMFGWRYVSANAGISLILAAVAAAMLAASLRPARLDSAHWLRTPLSRWSFVGWGVLAMGLLVPGVSWGLHTDMRRMYFPWCADSIGIPLFGITISVVVVTPILALIGLLISAGFGRLPVPLTQWDWARPGWSWAVSLIFGAALVGWLGLFLWSLRSADLTSPSAVLGAYLLASTRAALLAPRQG